MTRTDLCCSICKKSTGNNVESHAFKISVLKIDIELASLSLDTDNRDFILCADPLCRIKLFSELSEEAEIEIISSQAVRTNQNTE